MRVYIEFMKNTIQSSMAYKFDTFLRLFSGILFMFIQVSIWRALFKGATEVGTGMGAVTINEMITYAIISTLMSVIISSDAVERIGEKIRSGEVSIDLIRPINFLIYIFSETIGSMGFRVVFEIIPLSILGISLWGISYPSIHNALLFSVALINGMLLYFLLAYIMGLLAIWYMTTAGFFNQIVNSLIRLFSGAFIPLWFFPKTLLGISNFLPFRLIYFTPLSIYLERIEYTESIKLILLQLLWIGILIVIQRIVWRKGIKRIVIQGG